MKKKRESKWWIIFNNLVDFLEVVWMILRGLFKLIVKIFD